MNNLTGKPTTATLRDWFGLHRNVVAVSLAMFFFRMGECLWEDFRSAYLRALGAQNVHVGWFGATKDTLDGLYQYPGGWLTDHLGRRAALTLFGVIALVGYAIYAVAPRWEFVFVGLFFVMAWASLANPAIFATIGDALPKERRAIAFTVQSILRRVPSIIAPPIGGAIIDAFRQSHGQKLGTVYGVKVGLAITLVIGVIVLIAQYRAYAERKEERTNSADTLKRIWRNMQPSLKALLFSDIFIRAAESLTDVFLVLYASDVANVSGAQYGMLISVSKATSILVYIPVAKKSDQLGRKPFALMTFVFFALFPLTVALSATWTGLLIAFIFQGLREIGEPPRKAMIVDLADPAARGRTVGLYYLIRSISIAPGAAIGGKLYDYNPHLPFYLAFGIGCVGVVLFAVTVKENAPAHR